MVGQKAGQGGQGCREFQDEGEGRSQSGGKKDRVAQEYEGPARARGQRGQTGGGAEGWAWAQEKAVEWKC